MEKNESTNYGYNHSHGILFLFLAGSISEGGLNGPAFGVGTGSFILFVSISANKRFTVINSTLYVLVLSTGLAIDYFFPEIIVNYKNEKQRHLDFMYSTSSKQLYPSIFFSCPIENATNTNNNK
jgi:hypothetical protein